MKMYYGRYVKIINNNFSAISRMLRGQQSAQNTEWVNGDLRKLNN